MAHDLAEAVGRLVGKAGPACRPVVIVSETDPAVIQAEINAVGRALHALRRQQADLPDPALAARIAWHEERLDGLYWAKRRARAGRTASL